LKNYNETTWQDLNKAGRISPVCGIDAATTMQVAEYLGVTPKELLKPRGRAASDLKQLGMFTAAIRALLPRIPGAEKISSVEYVLPLEDGGSITVPCSQIVYCPAAAVARLADEVRACSTVEEKKVKKNNEDSAQYAEEVNMEIFENPEFGTIRTVEIDGEPWLVGKDVAAALGYSNPRKALSDHVNEEDKNTVTIRDGIPGNPNMTIINESGLYALVLSSKLPGAKKFKHWVTSKVLPSIRKHGMYATPRTLSELMADPETAIQLFTRIKEEQEKSRALQEKVSVLECENHMLAKREQTWEPRNIVVRLVRMYGRRLCNGNFSHGWNEFYRELYYKKGINLRARPGSGLILDRVKDTEWEDLISVAAAMCDGCDVDFSWAVNGTNAAAVQACR